MTNSHRAFLIAQTATDTANIQLALDYLGAPNWLRNADAVSASELLTEFAGRLCYKSFVPGLNPNVTKVREGNSTYLENVLKQKHGSVLEHAYTTFALLNVSRIFTHELVRHRAGMAYSQESQRYVRLDTFDLYIPDLTPALAELSETLDYTDEQKGEWVQDKQSVFVSSMEKVKTYTQGVMKELIQEMGLDNATVPFHVKKQITSALRRLLPGGVNTHIVVTGNHRAWRHIVTMRTSEGAEDEIVEVIGDIALQLVVRYPGIYQDMVRDPSGKHFHFTNEGV